MIHHQILFLSVFIFSCLFIHYTPNNKRIVFKAPYNLPQQSCFQVWCSQRNQFVLPSALITLIKELDIGPKVYKRNEHIETIMEMYTSSIKYKYLAVDVKSHNGIVLLNYYIKCLWAAVLTKRELLLNELLLPTAQPIKKLKTPITIVNSVKQLFETKDMITGIDPAINMNELNVPMLKIPTNMAIILLDHVIYQSVLPDTLLNTIQLYQQVLSDPAVYSIAVKINQKTDLKCIDKMVKLYKNPILFISGPKKLVRKVELKYFYLEIRVLTTIQSKSIEISNTKVDWPMIHDFISLSANHLVFDEQTKAEFLPFLTDQKSTLLERC